MYANNMICDTLDYIDKNIKTDIKIEDISNYLSFNRYYIMKRFKKELNISIVLYIKKLRIFDSLELLRNSNDSIISISIDSGFNSLEYYSEVFKEVVGVSPQKFRQFCKRILIEEKEYNFIVQKLSELDSFFEFIKTYRERRKPKNIPIKKRTKSIFNSTYPR